MLATLFRRCFFHRPPLDQRALDRALALWQVESPGPELASRILAETASLPQLPRPPAPIVPREARGIPLWPSPLLWPGAAAFALAVLLGYMAASHGLEFANDDALNMAEAAALQEDFGDL
ncbi:hypothetical protein [Methylogaea oryzae]|uniref:Uncharacterized protein n=1 Tax=Methylogaea oryzae TaxID=1295382 RepID=A0A8D4VNK9_9GAMM|nr:hypothetical protein [Methylogaea oryzae]BBL70807.1 hypothetical protein MoryE10_14130 [Methylogaea oryzae]